MKYLFILLLLGCSAQQVSVIQKTETIDTVVSKKPDTTKTVSVKHIDTSKISKPIIPPSMDTTFFLEDYVFDSVGTILILKCNNCQVTTDSLNRIVIFPTPGKTINYKN